jgi:D-alanine transaminase
VRDTAKFHGIIRPITEKFVEFSVDTVFLNGQYLPKAEAKISPMDRGFLFGDGIYEVIPSYAGRCVGLHGHLTRLQQGLAAIGMAMPMTFDELQAMIQQLIELNGRGNLGIYLHISRGTDSKRFHAFPENIAPTIFAYAFAIAPEPIPDKTKAKGYKVVSTADLRWQRCHIKSTSLLGNVLHFQQGHAHGVDETILFNEQGFLTEASACNVFIVKAGEILTPPLDHQLLPGITRQILLAILEKDGNLPFAVRPVSMEEVRAADEIWLTSSSKEIAPVIEIDDKPVGKGMVGDMWLAAQTLFSANKYAY